MPEALQALNNGVPIAWYLILSAVLFALGVAGFLFRRNIITVFMCIELMLNAVNLSFVAFSNQHKLVSGQIFTFFVMVVAAADPGNKKPRTGRARVLFRTPDLLALYLTWRASRSAQITTEAVCNAARNRLSSCAFRLTHARPRCPIENFYGLM